MREIDDNTRQALFGSRAGDKLVVYAWYNGELIYPDPLPISTASFDWDVSRQVQKFGCVVQDNSGELSPWLLGDPLGIGGTLLEVRWMIGGTNGDGINIGWYRIAHSTPDDHWRTYVIDELGAVNPGSSIPNDKRLVFVPGGSAIEVEAYELTIYAKNDRLLAPESPKKGSSPTILSEITRLMQDVCPVTTAAGVVDRAVATNIVYERERLDAVQDLCKRIFCDYRMTGDGQLEVYPLAEQAPVETLQGGPDGVVVRIDREQSLEGQYNCFVVDGTRKSGGKSIPVRSIAQITSGPLSAYGPMGRIPTFYSSTMITSQADADEYAQEMMDSQLAGLTVDIAVKAVPMPHLQQGDWVTVANPVVGGKAVPLIGRISQMKLSWSGTVPGPMELVVQCSYSTIEALISEARYGNY